MKYRSFMHNIKPIYVCFILSFVFISSYTESTQEIKVDDNSLAINKSLALQLMSVWESGDTAIITDIFHFDGRYIDIPTNHTFEGIQ